MEWLGDEFVKEDGSTATLSDATDGKLVIVMYVAAPRAARCLVSE